LGATSFSYDLKGRLSAITTPDGQQLQYDYDGFLEKKVSFSGSIQGSLERVYDSDFKVTQLKLNGQALASFSYDNDGLLTQAGPLAITRDPQTGFWLSSQAGVTEESRSFDAYGQLQSQQFKVSGASILKITYERDSLGRITAKNEERPSGITRFEYGYEPAGRLVSERKILPDGSSLVTQWSYDGNGNRVMEVRPNGTVVTGTYDDQDRLLTYGDLSFTYTANGELISKCQGSACQYFDYDVFGNLRHVILDNGMEIEYVIDGRNRRIGKKINGTLVQGFIYDDQLRIVAELDGSNQVVSRFIYADHINVPEVMEKGGKTYRVLHDHLGSPRFVIDTQTGQIVQELHYDAWGNVVFDSNPGFQPFGFAGGLYDPHTKLVRFGARDYDPQLGRWTGKDPIRFADPTECGGVNLYLYACTNPVLTFDPAGLYSVKGRCGTLDPHLAVMVACGRMVGKCEEVLRRHGKLECMRESCKRSSPCPRIVCDNTLPRCGEHVPCFIKINPNLHSWSGKTPCGPPDATIFHEFLHECGADEPTEEPAFWKEIEKWCGKDIPGGYQF
jgi:RHS repeat-associated protein